MNKTFENVSTSTFACLKTKLQEQGITLEGTEGYLSKNGISLDFVYTESAETMSVINLEVGFPASLAGMNAEKVMGILEKTISNCQ